MSNLEDVSGSLKVPNQSQNEKMIIFSWETLHKATNGFRTWMGSHRSSYKGTLENGTVVFVKEIRDHIWGPDEDFLSLVKTISTIRHPNVAKFLGYCDDGGHVKFIVYEFGGVHDLDVLLFTSHPKSVDLTWPVRASICLGIACGLDYLHRHGLVVPSNIKPFNILLDEDYNPKIVGFNIKSVHLGNVFSHHMRMRYGIINVHMREDIKAFGILLLEVISGRVLHDSRDDKMPCGVLLPRINDLEGFDDVLKTIDPRLTELPPEVEVQRFIDVALRCLRQHVNMPKVVRILSGKLDLRARREAQLGIHVHKSGKVVVESAPSNPVIETRGQNVHDMEIETEFEASISDGEPTLEASVNPIVAMAPHAASDTLVHNEDIEGISFEIEDRQLNKVLSPSEVNLDRPIHNTVGKILTALRDAQYRRIGLCGSGGSGKTAVLRTLSHHPAVRNLFDQIIFVSVPRLYYRRKIQSQIMQQLSLNESDYKSEDEAAAQICNALTGTSRKVLLLLDDVREIMNLHEVGISNLDPTKGCWLLLATRSLDVCQEMADKEIEMEVLSAAEGWELFRCQVGDIVDDPGIEPYARTIAKECHGLPLIISAVASTLKVESDVSRWRLALRSILYSKAPLTRSLRFENSSPQIHYCYKMLEDDAKPCFLYSALFSSEKEIDISTLVDCFTLGGLLEGRTSDSYRKGYEIVRHLINASLLETTANGGNKVKMHNIIKDSALEIFLMKGCQELTGSDLWAIPRSNTFPLSSIDKCLTRAGAEFKEPPALEEWKQATMIFLMDNKLSSLPSNPDCHTLEALFLQRNLCIRAIPASFFNNMDNLGILNLSKTRIKFLPDSFSKLASLQVFIMCDCERLSMLPPSIGDLRSLKVLDLQGTELIHLPESVSELAELKQLQVSFYGSISHNECSKLPSKLIPDGVISSLDLEELGIFVHPGDQRWALSVSNVIKELRSRELHALYFHFPDEKHLDQFLDKWQEYNLTSFNFIVGHDFKHGTSQVSYDAEIRRHGKGRRLRFVNGESVPRSVQKVLSRTTSFYLDHHLNICNLSDFGIDNINKLEICILRDCPNIQSIVHNEQCSRSLLPFLRYLSINYLWNLKRIWVGQVSLASLLMLRHLSLQACPKLTYVLTYAMLDNLSALEELVIEDCASLLGVIMEHEVAMDDATSSEPVKQPGVSEMSTTTREAILPRLKVLKLHHLPKLCGIWEGHCWPPLEYISFYNCPKLKNLHLEARDAMNIKEIAVDKAWWDLLQWDNPTLSRKFDEHVVQINLNDL